LVFVESTHLIWSIAWFYQNFLVFMNRCDLIGQLASLLLENFARISQ
jgi:hypothetical protein